MGKGYANVAFIWDERLKNYSYFLRDMQDGMGNGSG